MKQISDLLEEISSLLSMCSYVDEASWLQKRAIKLRSASGEGERTAILTEVKGKIAGMGSLSDIYLLPPKNAPITKQEANHRLGDLIRELDNYINDILRA